MDGSAPMLKSKKRKSFGDEISSDGEDRISCLPNNLLHHILSVLPTKYVVATSMLSTRWKFFWTSISMLDFDDELLNSTIKRKDDPMIKRSFMNFVDRVLLLHDKSSIRRFCLSCTTYYDTSRINAWISTVIKRDVEELFLSVPVKQPFVFPRCLFSCESLTTLAINMRCDLKFPSSICFPYLKVLHLRLVTFRGDHSIQQVELSFPVLEEFLADEVSWVELNTVKIYAPLLKRLVIEDWDNCTTIHECQIYINAESLRTFEYESAFSWDYRLYNASPLVDVVVDAFHTSRSDISRQRLIELLSSLRNVKHLHLSAATIETFSHWDTFSKLLPLSGVMQLTVVVSDDGFHANSLIKLLHKMPNIQYLTFEGPYSSELYGHDWAPITVPQCILTHLKFIELEYFSGSEFEFSLVKFLLKNAEVLQELTLTSSEDLSVVPKKHAEASKKLLMLPKGSACSVINFS